ncbi:ACT domain-containing protein [candidate division KSB1 bacterium]|nr:ACT domain-containing protein [candidate division KSB1 bacterium]
MIIKQLSVFIENESGRLTEVCETLAQADVNISALSVADTAEYGILRMIVSNPVLSAEILAAKGFSVRLTQVIGLIMPDTPGALARALRILSDAGIIIEYLYAFSFQGKKATVVIRTEEPQQAIDALHAQQMELRRASEFYEI